MAFQSFKQVGQAQTPNLIAAQIADDRMNAENNARRTRMLGQLGKGGVGLYNELMGDRTPIADYLGLSEPTGDFAAGATNYAIPEAAGATSGINSGALASALRAPAMESGAMNLAGLTAAPEAAAGLEALGAFGGALPELGLTAAAAPTAGLNAATIGGALAPAAAEVGLGAGAATAAGSVLPPLGIALALGSLFGLFG